MEILKIGDQVSLYDEYQSNINRNLIDNFIIESTLKLNPSIKEYVNELPISDKRMAILLLFDYDRTYYSSMKNLIDNNEVYDINHLFELNSLMNKYFNIGKDTFNKYYDISTDYSELVVPMFDSLSPKFWCNHKAKILDNSNGTGIFTLEAIRRFMIGLESWELDPKKRYKHIVENIIHVCEIQPINQFIWQCICDPNNEYNLNLYTSSFLDDSFEYYMNGIWKVNKFDLVFGCPPSYEKDNGNTSSARPIYNKFVLKSINISKKVLSLTPSRWFASGKGLSLYRNSMVYSNKIRYIRHYEDTSEFFNGKKISGGISYFLYDNSYNGKCNFNGKRIDLKKHDIIIRYSEDIEYIDKVIKKVDKYDSVQKYGKSRDYFKIETNDKRLSNEPGIDGIKCIVSKYKGGYKYISPNHIDVKKLDKHKVLLSRTCQDMNRGLSSVFYLEPGVCFNNSFMHFEFDTKEQCDSFISYLKSEFVDNLIRMRKINSSIKPSTFKWVPNIPLDREWNDDKINKFLKIKSNVRIQKIFEEAI